MNIEQKLDKPHLRSGVTMRFEKVFIYMSVLGFLSIAGIYLLFI